MYPEKREYTYFSARTNAKASNKGWRIDYFVVHSNDLSMVSDVTIHKDFNGSDHVPIHLHLDLSKIESNNDGVHENDVKESKSKSKSKGK